MTLPGSRTRWAVLVVAGLVLTGCSADRGRSVFRDKAVPTGSFQLVAFNSCDDALGRLKEAAKQYVGPWGFGGGGRDLADSGGGTGFRADAPAAPGAPEAATGGAKKSADEPSYSGTNTHEVGVDEPDLVKTDGRRILTVSKGVLRVIDAQSRRLAGRVDLAKDAQDAMRWSEVDLLLQGDHALVLVKGGYGGFRGGPEPGIVEDGTKPAGPDRLVGPRLLLVDLAGDEPAVIATYTVDGQLVDARQVGATARVVVRSAPRLAFPHQEKSTDAQRLTANKALIDRAGPDEWFPRYEATAGGRTTKGRVGCEAVSRPAVYTGTSMVTVLSFDLGRSTLGSGDPVTIVADGDTVYSNGDSLYVANDQRWRAAILEKPGVVTPQTEIYKFDTSGAGTPRYVGAGSVPGWLLNQYSLSEWDDHLRVATTSGQEWGRNAKSESAVYVLKAKGKQLVETGKVTGLGKGERIYAVRFVGTTGYVVTFRQTDPLYTVDLRNPAAPRVVGELKITGYSAYLHPAGGSRLIGIGQEASEQGRVQGTQVSLFDVADLAKPTRVAQYHVKFGQSEAEFDPHAFLYWQKSGLLVVPLNLHKRGLPGAEALVLRVTGGGITEVGAVEHPTRNDGSGQIRRSLIIDDVLWTVSAAGAKASNGSTLDTLAWLPF